MLTAAFLLTVAAFLLVSSAAFAVAEDDVKYIDENGIQRTHNDVTIIDGSYFAGTPYILDDLGESGGWYLVRGTFVLNNTITVRGEVHLILENDCNLRINGSTANAGINVSGTNSLTIYEQPDAAGKTTGTIVTVAGYNGACIGGGYNGSGGNITINGGTVSATRCISGAGIGGGASGGTITINGGDAFPWWVILLFIAGFLLLLILFYRRRYEVIKAEGPVSIIGKDKAHRKSAYRFSAEGAGLVSYRIGESGTWKTLSPDADGEYMIPKGEITDNVTIECR